MRVLIIEDEKLLQKELTFQLNKIDTSIEIVHYISTVSESIDWLQKASNTIDLIFMDIELSDGICFEIFKSINVKTPIIFLTAYNEYAIQAFKLNSIDYLLKPINAKDLVFALNKYKTLKSSKINLDIHLIKQLYNESEMGKTKRILIQSGEHFKFIDHSDVAYFVAEDKYTTVVTFNNEKHLIDDSLNQLEQNLPHHLFYRPTRKYIININSIVKASKYYNSRLKLHINPSPENEIIISRNKTKEFLSWMGN